jgi:NhaA family Na+:H+ antiporter
MMTTLLKKFLRLESTSGLILLIAALLAMIAANSSMANAYNRFINFSIELDFKTLHFSHSLSWLVNEGLMPIFFLFVGLELKREFYIGELSSLTKIMLPAVGALGGMILPGIIYTTINFHQPDTLTGWAIPVATDIAFAIGVLSLFGNRIPKSLKLFLLALAIFDDLGAIIIIAFFHTRTLSSLALIVAIITLLALWKLNKLKTQWLTSYLLVGFLLWLCILTSGIHPTIAGVLLALMIPLNKNSRHNSPLIKLETGLHPWVAFLILPLFAFVNAGVSITGLTSETFSTPITLGIIAGLFLGKQLGVFSFIWISVKLNLLKLPQQMNWINLYGVTVLCGIGFTMSLFLGILAFENNAYYLMQMRIGVLCASILSALFGACILLTTTKTRS